VDFIKPSHALLGQPNSGQPVLRGNFRTSQTQCYTRLLGAVLMMRIAAFCIVSLYTLLKKVPQELLSQKHDYSYSS